MKTILYVLIALIMLGIIIPSFTNKTNSIQNIVIQPVDGSISSAALAQSAQIISARLQNFSSEKSEVKIIPEKNQIAITLSEKWDLNIAGMLILQKGNLSFYESYNKKELAALLNGDNHLFSLFNSSNTGNQDPKIGCVSLSGLDKINGYLNSAGLVEKCKFVWSNISDKSEACLYVLKLNSTKEALLTWADIESMKSIKNQTANNYEIEIQFKQPAVDIWSKATKQNIGKAIVILLDNNILYAPILKSEIANGTCSITGNFTEPEATFIAAIGSNGELPVNFEFVK